MDKNNIVELLAPAGDFQSLKVAVFQGANAVYLGAKNFNARAKAENFDDNLKSAVTFCHLYGVKVYLTLNTLMEQSQAKEILNTVKFALECGVDAFIVQDLGIAYLIKKYIDIPVELHASTQMAINNYLGAVELERLGFKRVVVSRETDICDIKLIKEKTNLQIEYFVQGALCVCFSGTCYLSSFLFNKSGNKGECLQPCRLKVTAKLKGKTLKSGYLLSAKDLNLSKRLKELIQAGVDSFKIEGRLRRPAYVSAVVKTYKNIIENNFETSKDDQNTLKKAFNRGDFCEGYLNGNNNIISPEIQGHKGLKIGQVKQVQKGKKFNKIFLSLNHNLKSGDTLKFVLNNHEIGTITAVDIKFNNNLYEVTTTNNLIVNADVYLIVDKEFEQNLLGYEKKLLVDVSLFANPEEKLKLEYNFNGTKGEVFGEVLQKSLTHALTFEEAKASLEKLNDTYFILNNFAINTNNAFVRKQQLNQIRRDMVSQIMNKYSFNKKINILSQKFETDINNLLKNIKNKRQINSSELLNPFVICPEDYFSFDYEKVVNMQKEAYLYIPAFLRNADILVLKNILNKYKNLNIYADNLGAINLARSFKKKIILGARMNIKNIYYLQFLFEDKFILNNTSKIVLSAENIDSEMYDICQVFNKEIYKKDFANFELMTLVHCPIKMLFSNDCKNCKYCKDIEYILDNGQKLKLTRKKLADCYFYLTSM